jgi:hypothetical protein
MSANRAVGVPGPSVANPAGFDGTRDTGRGHDRALFTAKGERMRTSIAKKENRT